MIQEEKSLLLKDLCARLPYGFKYQVQYGDTSVRDVEKFILDDECSLFDTWMVHEIKPYLRPLSSMTEEEREEYKHIAPGIVIEDGIRLPNINQINWLNAHHFDYRGLIEKGLALKAPKGMYNVKN